MRSIVNKQWAHIVFIYYIVVTKVLLLCNKWAIPFKQYGVVGVTGKFVASYCLDNLCLVMPS